MIVSNGVGALQVSFYNLLSSTVAYLPALLFAIILLLIGWFVAVWLGWVLAQQYRAATTAPRDGGEWVAFDEATLANYRKAGQPVFVDVTADWCVTCKYNERFVLSQDDVKRELRNLNAVLMRADWTNRDANIAAYLMKHGRAGIPFYAYYPPGKDPVVLSEFLTVKQVLKALKP
jgi:thiol:disulfide interchange protein DsbD